MTAKPLISREEALAGMTGRSIKRANTLLALIENRTARLAAQSQPPVALILAETTLKARNQAFLEAIALGREPPVRPAIQAIERYARHWAALIPDDASVRATVTNLLAKKYRFTYQATPELRLALGLDNDMVQQAYQWLYGQPLATIYAPAVTPAERLGWAWAAFSGKLEALPPFWLTFALNLPGAAGLLALPIALAQVGLATGLVLLVVFGLINLLTVTALAETVARSGLSRFGLGFLGQLTHEYLGPVGSTLMTVTLAVNSFFVLIIFYMGVATTLEEATRLPAEVWVAALFGICLYFLSRKSLNATVATTLIIIFINLVILLVIPLLTLPHVQAVNLAVDPVRGPVFTPVSLQLIFGIMLSTYFSHLQVVTYGPVVLRHDPGARTWIWGSATAILVYMLICCFWLVVVNGAISPQTLAGATGTVLSPLAEKTGPIIHLLGSLLVILSLGLLSVQISLGLYYLVMERMPARSATSPFNRLSERGRFWLAVSPVGLVFLLAEWAVITGFGTFTSLLNILSALVLPLLGGIFPVLLLAATRRKGDFVPGVVYRALGHPVTLAALYLFFLSIIFLHGLFIWEALLPRLAALGVGLAVLGTTIFMLRRGALASRAVIELRDDQSLTGQPVFNVTDSGQMATVSVQLHYPHETQTIPAATGKIASFSQLQAVSLQPSALVARQFKVWVHRLTPEGDSVGLAGFVVVERGHEEQKFDRPLSGGQVALPLDGEIRRLEIKLTEEVRSKE